MDAVANSIIKIPSQVDYRYNSNLIIDVGMHIGRDTELYLKKGFNVVAIEANPNLVKTAQTKFRQEIQDGQLCIYNIGITEYKGEFTFFVNESKDDWSSFNAEWNKSMFKSDTKITKLRVKGIPMDELLREVGVPYYLKIDIEGNDVICLKSLYRVNILPRFISIELQTFNNLPNQKNTYLEIVCHLGALGYRNFKIVDQSKNESTKCPFPAREGHYTDISFDGASSGLFGKELEGEWQTLDEITFDYLYYLRNSHLPVPPKHKTLKYKLKQLLKPTKYYDGKLDKNGWFDIHATF